MVKVKVALAPALMVVGLPLAAETVATVLLPDDAFTDGVIGSVEVLSTVMESVVDPVVVPRSAPVWLTVTTFVTLVVHVAESKSPAIGQATPPICTVAKAAAVTGAIVVVFVVVVVEVVDVVLLVVVVVGVVLVVVEFDTVTETVVLKVKAARTADAEPSKASTPMIAMSFLLEGLFKNHSTPLDRFP